MSKFLRMAVTSALVLVGVSANAQFTAYDPVGTRATLKNLFDNPPKSRVELVGNPTSAQAEAFLKFYEEKVQPHNQYIRNLIIRYSTLRLLRDSGSFVSTAEEEQWTKDFDALDEEYNEMLVDENWTETLREWNKLAEGLTGTLADTARHQWHQRDLESFPPEKKADLDRIAVLEREYFDTVRKSDAAKKLREFMTQVTETRRAFKTGAISFEEGRKKIAELFNTMGGHFVGAEAAAKSGENLNQIAILRTQLAKFKGFATHADYALEMSGQGYSPEYRGSANQRKFLKDYLTALLPVQKAFYDQRLKALGLEDKADEIRIQDIGFLTPPNVEMLQPYFPNDKISEMWGNTLLESGFDKEQLSQILLDDQFRDNKNKTEAYLSGVLAPYNEFERIDAATLNYVPMVRTKPDLKPGLVYILQSYKGSGLNDLRTAFHEGGHATEKLLKYKDIPLDEGYGYVEVPSLTSEFFMKDPEVVTALAVEANGKRPTLAEVTEALNNFAKVDVINDVTQVAFSLFDLELWSIDYTAPGAPTFLEAVKQVNEYTESLSEPFPDIETKVPLYFQRISTGHFTSGSVRNIGYVYASIGAEMMFEHISNQLEKQTGRRGWYKQPGFAKIYADEFVSQGWRKPFPENIETITGRKFDFQDMVDDFARKIHADECSDKLRPRK